MSAQQKILFVVTSADKLLNGKPTGFYIPEAAHPLYVVLKAGFKVDFASPKGGKAPVDPSSIEAFKDDKECQKLLNEDKAYWTDTLKLSEVKADDYASIFYVGGHGPGLDLATDKTSVALIEKFFSDGKPVGAVCHGPVVFHEVKDPKTGKSIYEGRRLTGFSNEEEVQVGMVDAIPFLLEDDIKAKKGHFVYDRKPWGEEVVVDNTGGTIITGGNPASAKKTGEAIVHAVQAQRAAIGAE